MKRLEGEVTRPPKEIGETQAALGLAGHTVDPHQFLGIELNPWAAAIAELVLWIGYLQWHFRTHGRAAPSEPVLRDFHNIENRDAVLAWDTTTPRTDTQGHPVGRRRCDPQRRQVPSAAVSAIKRLTGRRTGLGNGYRRSVSDASVRLRPRPPFPKQFLRDSASTPVARERGDIDCSGI